MNGILKEHAKPQRMFFDRLDERNITVESIVHFDNFGYQQV